MEIFRLYIDPSVMSYGLQIIIGVAITCGAIAGIVLRKVKKNVKKTLNIEDKKSVEEDIVEINSGEETETE